MQSFFKSFVVYMLRVLAQATLKTYKPKIIAVTGNIGKTSTKDAVFAAIATTYSTRKSYKSFNSEIGVPLTILGEDNQWSNPLGWFALFVRSTLRLIVREEYPTWLVLEVGADAPGDIENITKWLKPDIAVLTQFGEVPVHIENYKNDRTLVVKEKAFLPKALKKDGVFVYCGDDADASQIAEDIKRTKVSFGYKENNTVSIHNDIFLYDMKDSNKKDLAGMQYELHTQDGNVVHIERKGYLGRVYAVAGAAACAVSQVLNVDLALLDKALSEYTPESGRMRILDGIKDSILLDDTYNAAPKAMKHALDTLQVVDARGKKIAILGDMLELGKHTEKVHKDIGKEASQAAHTLITVGMRARFIVEGALNEGMNENNIFQFEDSRSAGKFAESIIQEGDVVLIKGSQGIRMERVAEELLRYPEMKEDLLVRQNDEWRTR
jgi:UDP-N-acetylmuramoyl-tripeptide--D-alanyl-D-alanine ligase